jgi:hypothetical protein
MFQHYTTPIYAAAFPTPNSAASSHGAAVGDSSISFDHGSHGKIAVVTPEGLKCDADLFPEKTSKEFAQMLYESLQALVSNAHFERGKSPVKWMIGGKSVMEVGERTLELNVTGPMSHFDQWVFTHLQQLWKERRI